MTIVAIAPSNKVMKKDIETREELETFLWSFYKKAFADELIGRFFTEVVPLDLDTHVPIIANFWESVAFNKPSYRKNVMEVHQHIHDLSKIKKEHLERWVKLFTETLDENFEGTKTELMKQRARSIATLMDIKLNHNQISNRQ
jgi:hemoglobin